METVDTQTLEGFNALLEDERASVEVEVALLNGATELTEREVLASMGTQEVGFCVGLRERLEGLGAQVTGRISGVVFHILDAERYDDRLTLFADHQMQTAERVPALLPTVPDHELRAVLRDLEDAHLRAAAWCRRRAAEFAATRLLVFRGQPDYGLGQSYGAALGPLAASDGAHNGTARPPTASADMEMPPQDPPAAEE
jgi:hypothetical protein